MGRKRIARRQREPALHIEELEPRLLLSADPVGAFLPGDFDPHQLATEVVLDDNLEPVNQTPHAAETENERLELVFVDTDTPDYQQLVDDLLTERNDGRRIDVVVLDNSRDGISQVSETLESHQAVDAIHLISHGSDASLDLGSSRLSGDNVADYQAQLRGWGEHLSAEADILIYGCNLAASADGRALVEQIANLTGADIAASDDLTGSATLGGDYDLEYQTGYVQADLVFTSKLQGTWQGLLAPVTVSTKADNADSGIVAGNLSHDIAWLNANMGADNAISLREAMIAANNTTGTDTIDFEITESLINGAHTITLTAALPDISDTVIIDGTSDSDYAGAPIIELDGTNTAADVDGFRITLGGSGSTIKGFVINRFTGFYGSGIEIDSANSVTITGNYIGTDVVGGSALGMGAYGAIHLNSADGNFIIDNVISGNDRSGIWVLNSGDNTIQGNFIGTGATGTGNVGNQGSGISLSGSYSDNLIGGVNPGEGNVIAYNDSEGITFANSGTGNAVLGNVFFSNGDLAIDLKDDNSVTANDAGDVDTGSNNLQNFPVLSTPVTSGGGSITIEGQLHSNAGTIYRIEFFASSAQDSLGHGEAERFLGAASVTTDASGDVTFSETFSELVSAGEYISATATVDLGGGSFGDTSEFAANMQAVNSNSAPVITSNGGGDTASVNVVENTTAVTTVIATDVNLDTLTYSLDPASDDDGFFAIDSGSGVLSFSSAPNFELPADLNGDNIYEVTVRVSDGNGGLDTQAISVTVTDALELVVTNTNATGTGSLHEAILNANANTGVTDTISFNIGSGPQTILVDAGGLPIIEDSLILDATTQPGYSGTPLITLDGSATPASSGINGITLRTNDSTVKGFIVHSFADEGIEIDGSTGFGDNNTIQNNWVGIDASGTIKSNAEHNVMISVDATGNLIGGTGANDGNVIAGSLSGFDGIIIRSNSDNNTIQGNYIGVLSDGVTAAPNAGQGISILLSSDGNQIGGTVAGAGNVISGNTGDGIQIDGATDATYTTSVTGTIIQGNLIGTDISGTVDVGNGGRGVHLLNGANANTIGGTLAGATNVISGNSGAGIYIEGSGTDANVMQGNLVGTDATGTQALGNSSNNININSGASNNVIGGAAAGAGNVIADSANDGISIWGGGTTGNIIQGNYIGTDISGTIDLGNNAVGAVISGGSANNILGGTGAGEGNTIAFNNDTGISIRDFGSLGNSILANSIYSNANLGIDLGGAGVTANDAGDVDNNIANNLQNFPVITKADLGGTDLTLSGSLDTDGISTQYRIEFFGDTAGTQDASNGEARAYLGFITVTTNGSGDATFSNVTLSGVTLSGGDYVTATATKIEDAGQVGISDLLAYGSTSEFAANISITDVNSAPTDLVTTTTSTGGLELNADGGNDTYFVADNGGVLLGGLNTVTVEATFSIANPPVDNAPLLSYAVVGQDEELGLFIKNDGRIWFLAHSPGSPYQSTALAYPDLIDGEVHHVAVSWDALGGDVVFYIDGAEVESFSGYQTGQEVTGGGQLVIGQDQDTVLDGFATIDVFSGTLYDVRIFNDVRTSSEITDNFDQTLPPTESGMIANWTFDDLITSGVITDTVSGNNLTEQHVVTTGFSTSVPELSLQVVENAANGTVVGSVSTIDPDSGDTFTYSLQDDAAGRFAIHASTGQITVANGSLIEFETASSHDITVRTTDAGGLSYDEVFTILVANVNYAPGGSVTIDNTNPAEGDLLTASNDLTDEDGLGTITYTWKADGTLVGTGATYATTQSDVGKTITVEASYTDGQGKAETVASDPTVAVTNVNNPPSVTNTAAQLSYIENDGPVVVDAGVTVSDVDGGNLVSATVRILSGFVSAEDSLAFTNQLGITGSYNAGTGILSLSGTASIADYQTALRTVTYQNGSENPDETNRTISFQVSDGTFTAGGTRTVTVTAINDDAYNTGSVPADVTVVEDTPGYIDLSSIVFADVDAGNNLIQVTLSTSNAGALVASSDFDVIVSGSGSGTMTLQGGVADLNNFFSSAFRFHYSNPTTHLAGDNADTITITVNDLGNTGSGGGGNVVLGVVNVDITPQNDAPVRTAGSVANLTVAEDSGLTSLGLDAVAYGPGGGADESGQALTFEVTVIPDALNFGSVYLADGITQVTTDFYTLAEIQGMQFKPVASESGGPSFFSYRVQDSGGTPNGGVDSITESIQLTISPAPVITSDGGGDTANINIAENATAVTTVTATDADLDTLTYSLDPASDDDGFFTIDSGSGVLSFASAPNFEVPADLDGDNVYEVTVRVSDGYGGVDTQAISVTVTDALELVVTNTNATGTGSLHEAILNANNNAGVTDTITFNISGAGPHTILVGAGGLPAITDTVIIDATTEPDYAGSPVVVLDGSSAGSVDGLILAAGSDGSTVRGLVINQFAGSGIRIDGSDNNTVAGNFIGTDVTGNQQAGNDTQATGITINNSSGNTIGGTAAGDANVLSGNRLRGVIIIGATSINNTVSGNFIGTNADGSAQLVNAGGGQQIGVYLYDTPDNTIGGIAAGAGNIISGNANYGIYAWGPNTTDNEIYGNTIGLDASGSGAIGNGSASGGGIMISSASGNLIGGTIAGAANIIAGHLGAGLMIAGTGANGNSILANAIYDNGALGIDLNADDVTANDTDDADTGANNLQNFPVISFAELDGSNLTLSGSLDTDGVNADYRVEFFGNAAGSQDTTNGEGRVYLGFLNISTDVNGIASFTNVVLTGITLSSGDYVTATATKIDDLAQVAVDDRLAYGDTSEFAANVVITLANVAPVLTNGTSGTYGEGSASAPLFASTVTDSDSADFNGGVLTFEIASGGDGTDTLLLGNVGGVSTIGNDVYVGGVLVGTQAGGAGGTAFTVTFNSDATPARVQSVFQALTIASLSDNPTIGLRNLEVTLTDGDGGTSNVATASANLTSVVNDDPSNDGVLAADVTVTEDVLSNLDLSGINFVDPDANSSELTVTLATSTGGELTLVASAGITLGGTATSSTVTGTLTSLNAYFNNSSNISYLHSTAHTEGDNADLLSISIVDNGNTGSGGGGSISLAMINIDIAGVNDGPTFGGTLDGTPTFTEGGAAVVLDGDVTVYDIDLEAADNYAGATLVLARDTGANADDVFSGSGNLAALTEGGDLVLSGVTIGTVSSNSGGMLGLIFNNSATAAAVDETLQSLAYANTSSAPPANVQIDWIFDDNNTGSQGSGAALQTSGSTVVTIDAINNAPVANIIPSGVGVAEDDSFRGVPGVSISDIDAGTSDLEVTLSVLNGALNLGNLTGLTVTGGANGSAAVTVTGMLVDLNTALATLAYRADADYNGSDTLSLTVSDLGNSGTGGALTDTDTVNITVTGVNDGPTITSTAGTTATEDTLYTYTATVTDPDDANDGTDLTWSLSGAPAGMVVSSTGVVTWTPAEGVTTSGAVTLTVSDGNEDGAVDATEVFTITVTPVNDGPTITSTAGTTATEDTLYTYTATVTDPDDANNGTDLTWSLSGAPAGMVVSSTGVVTWTPAEGVTTSGAVTLTVSDGNEDGAVDATEVFTITVTPVNDGPTITSTAGTTATEDTLYTYIATVTDPDDANDGTDLTWSLSGAPAGMVVSSTGVVTWTPTEGVTSSGPVTLTVSDGNEDGAVDATEVFTITVTPVNDGPTITSTAGTTATEDTLYTYIATVTDPDDANNGTDLTWSLSGAPAGMVVSSTGVVTWTPAEGVTTSGPVTLTVSDGNEDGAVDATEVFTITVTPVNNGPTITSTAGTSATEDTLYTYTATVSDPDDANNGTDLTWSLSGAPAGMVVSSTGVVTWTPAEGVTTSGPVTLTVSDGNEDGAVDATEVFTITVSPVNDAPTITSTAGTTATEDTLYTYTATVSDPDDANNGTDLTWSLSGAPAGMVVSSTGVVTWTPTEGVTSSGPVTLTVSDGNEDGAVDATEVFTITVTPVNDGPTITSTAGTTATEDTLYTYIATVTDPDDANDGTDLTWSLSGAPAGMVVSSTGVVTWTPAEGVTTSGPVTLTVSDGNEDGAVDATEVFTITVSPVNDAPTITSTAGTTATEDTLYTYTATVSDPDDANNGTDLTWSLSGAPAGMVVSSTGVVTWTPAEGVTTSGAVTLTVSDGNEDGAVDATEVFTITVTPVNDAPTITSTAGTTATEDTLYTYTATVSDPDDANNGTDLTWSLSGAPAGMVVSSTGVVTWTPAEGVTTSGAVTLTVSDGNEDGAVDATEVFTITVTPVNDGPTITSTAGTTATEDTLYTYIATVTDPDDANDGTDLTWSLSGAPAGMVVSSTGVVTWTPAEGVTSSGPVTLTVSDGNEDGAVDATEVFTITVTPVNDGPTITSTAGTTATEDTLYTYTATVTDPDDANNGTDLTWSLSGAPAGMVVSSTGVVTWTPAEGVTTSGAVTLTVSDGNEDGAVDATEVFTITVTAVNDAPVITSTAGTTATEDTLYTYTATVTDPDDANNGTDLTWSLSGAPAGMVVSSTGVVTWTPAEGVTTSGPVTLTVSDGNEDGAVDATEVFTITVTPVNNGPTITSTAGTSATEDTLYTYTATVSDPDDANNGTDLTWSLSGAPAGMVVSSTGVVTWTPAEGVTTSGAVTLTVSDGSEDGALDATEVFTITVTAVNDAPVITSTAGTTATEDILYTYTATVSDPDDVNNGTDLTWSLSGAPAGMVVSSTGVVTWTPAAGVTSSGPVTLTVSDGNEDGAVDATEVFTITVTPVNEGPTITSTAGTTATEDTLYTYTATVSDPDDANNGTDLTWSLSGAPAGMVVSSTGVVTWTPAESVTSSGPVTLTVSDGNEDGAVDATEVFTITVTPVNDAPAGSVIIVGIPQEDQVLSVAQTLTDADGMGALSYQWQSNGIDIVDETGETYTLIQADVGATITVVGRYTDGGGALENVSSEGVGPISNSNDLPSGKPTIMGQSLVGETLIVETSGITDQDGLGAFSYTWLRSTDGGLNWSAVGSESSYTLADGDAGANIRVQVTYVDAGATTENLLSDMVEPTARATGEPPAEGPDNSPIQLPSGTGTSPVPDGETDDSPEGGGTTDGRESDVPNLPGSAEEDASGGDKPEQIEDFSEAEQESRLPGSTRGSQPTQAIPEELLELLDATAETDRDGEGPDGSREEFQTGEAGPITEMELDFAAAASGMTMEMQHVERVLDNPAMWRGIDAMKRDMDDGKVSMDEFVVEAVSTSGAGLMAGLVAYALRGGALMASLLSTMPMMRAYDPLPILAANKKMAKARVEKDSATSVASNSQEIDALFE